MYLSMRVCLSCEEVKLTVLLSDRRLESLYHLI